MELITIVNVALPTQDQDALALWRLRSLHNNALRSYYIYEFLKKLLRSQEKTLLDQISLPVGIAASVFSVLFYIQSPASREQILVAYGVVTLALTGIPIIEGRYSKKGELDDVTYLGIYLDMVAKYEHEIRLASKYDQTDPNISEFIEDARDGLRMSAPYLRERIARLRATGEYPACLAQLARSEKWVARLNERIMAILEEGLL